VHAGDEVLVREKSRKIAKINDALAKLDRSPLPQWIEIDRDNYKGKIKSIPLRADVAADVDEQLIVELYNK
jgi:small subunit ribosomal protein S4